jgi:hypothetical protein
MRRFVVDHMETSADRIIGDMRLLLQDQPPATGFATTPPRAAVRGTALAWIALLVAGLFALEWFHAHTENEQLAGLLSQAQSQLQVAQDNLNALQVADAAVVENEGGPNSEAAPGAPGHDQNSQVESVPFGEMPLAGARLDQVSGTLARLKSQGFQGTLQVRSIPGRFCMLTNPAGALVPAPDATPYAKCEQVGNPREDNGSASGRQSVAFANMLAASRQGGGRIDVQVSAGSADETLTPYPAISDTLLAGEWNRAALANNRVEMHWQAGH